MEIQRKILTVFLCLFAASSYAANDKLKPPNTFIDFDSLSPGEQLTDQYISSGVTFDGRFEGNLTAGLIGVDGNYGTYSFGNSPPNFAIVGVGTLTLNFSTPVGYLSFRAGDSDVSGESFAVSAFDADGNLLDSQIMLLFEAGATVSISKKDISQVRIFGILGCVNCDGGFAIDDLSFVR